MRYLVGLVCVLALGLMPMVGCSDEETADGTGGAGGDGGGGVGGGGGAGGFTFECETVVDCFQMYFEPCMVACVQGLCELGRLEDGAECPRARGNNGICADGECRAPCETPDGCPGELLNDCTVKVCAAGGYCDGEAQVEDGTSCAGGTCQTGTCVLAGSALPCTEQGVRNAIAAGGGPYTFDCNEPTRVREHFRIDRDVSLDGEGKLIVAGFTVEENVVSELRGFTMTGSSRASVSNGGTLTLVNSTLSGNTRGIANLDAGNMTATGVTVSNNSGGGLAGGIYNRGVLTLINSTVSNNAQSCGSEAEFCLESGAGGIHNQGTLTLTNCTVSGNVTHNARASAISNHGTVTLTNCTISELGGPGARGWTIVNHEGETLTVTNTLIDGDCTAGAGATTASNGYNIESPYDSCGFDQPTDQVEVSVDDLNLWLRADNGGPTETHALGEGSVAIDQIPEADCEVETDQRGEPRPETGGTMCDVGAFEVQP